MLVLPSLVLSLLAGAGLPAWQGHGKDAQHTAIAVAAAQPVLKLHWKAPVDLDPTIRFGAILAHYSSTVITAANTAIVPIKTTKKGLFAIVAIRPGQGKVVWSESSAYTFPNGA